MVRVWVSHSDWESVMSVHGGGWGGGWVSQRQRGSTDRCWDGLWFPLSPTSNLPVMPQQHDGPELFRGCETQLRTASFKGLFDASIMFLNEMLNHGWHFKFCLLYLSLSWNSRRGKWCRFTVLLSGSVFPQTFLSNSKGIRADINQNLKNNDTFLRLKIIASSFKSFNK